MGSGRLPSPRADRWALCVEVVAEISRPGSLPHVGVCWRKSFTCLGTRADCVQAPGPAKAPIPCTVPARGTCRNSSGHRVQQGPPPAPGWGGGWGRLE